MCRWQAMYHLWGQSGESYLLPPLVAFVRPDNSRASDKRGYQQLWPWKRHWGDKELHLYDACQEHFISPRTQQCQRWFEGTLPFMAIGCVLSTNDLIKECNQQTWSYSILRPFKMATDARPLTTGGQYFCFVAFNEWNIEVLYFTSHCH